MNKRELTLLWPFYVTAFFSGSVSVALPVWIIMFQKEFSFLEISFALSLQCLAGILFEIPTGAVADVLGRKVSVTAGVALQGIVWLLFPLAHGPLFLYGAFFLMGLLRTLESGADKSWVVDWLKANRQKDLIDPMFARIQSLRASGRVVGCLLSSALLLCWDIRFLFLFQGCGYLAESILLFSFAREKFQRRRRRMAVVFRQAVLKTREGCVFMVSRKPLFLLILATTCLACSMDFGCIAWQPALVQLSLPAQSLGLLFAAAGLLGVVAPLCARRVTSAFHGDRLFLAGTTMMEVIILSLLYWIEPRLLPAGIVVFLSVCFITELQLPVASSLFHSLIPSRIRATVASAQSMICALASCATIALGGYAMDVVGAKAAILLLPLLLIPGTVLFILSSTSWNREKSCLLRLVPLWSPPEMFILPLCVPPMGNLLFPRRYLCF